ncbi:hypothetical protein AMELA_G00095820 [Ameiurus melas]|uniref:Uncharacterized protein n=1 Tax=Ameiurus melas TaxID=219545 RepID=A0A7J6ARH0_AMEME|nr:hypothetical protein AMELA_G00095820 [Ameiurus melas]
MGRRRLSSVSGRVNVAQWVQRESVSARNSPTVLFQEDSGTLRQARVHRAMKCVTRPTAKRTNSRTEECVFLKRTTKTARSAACLCFSEPLH